MPTVCELLPVKIVIRNTALKILTRMQPAKAADIRAAIDRVAAAPFAPNNNIRPLSGTLDGYRIRVGDWRVLYRLDRAADTMEVVNIAPRGGAYR